MKVLLLGGTGAMGTHLSLLLADMGCDVFVTTRKPHGNFGRITYIAGDALHDGAFLDSLLKERWDCIVDFMVYSTGVFKERAERFLSSSGQYVFLSSSRVYADSASPITENSPRLLDVCTDSEFLATDEYALAKARQEDALFGSRRKNWTIIRPYITYSEKRLQLGVMEKEEWLYLALSGNALVFSKDIAAHTTTLTYGRDVARGILAIVGQEKALCEAFHITGDGCAVRWAEVAELYKEVLCEKGIAPRIFEPEKCYRLEDGSSKWQVLYDRYYDRAFDNSKISRFVDTSSFLKPKDGLRMCLNEFLEAPEFLFAGVGRGIGVAVKSMGVRIPMKNIEGLKQKIKYILYRMHML